MSASILEHFKQLPDPRVDRTKRYPLMEIILLFIAATVSGCEGWKQIKDFGDTKLWWLRKYLPYQQGIPVDDTLARTICRLDTKAFQLCFMSWMKGVAQATENDIVAIDGKTLRRSYNAKDDKAAIHMVSAWSTANGVVLGQEKTSEKSNEITAIPLLLDILELKGCIVTIDAMGCQREIAKQIVDKKADYVLALKGNQPNLHEEVKTFFELAKKENFANLKHDYYQDIDTGHGRIETRSCWVVPANPKHFPGVAKWPKIKTIAMVMSERDLQNGKTTHDCRFYISSLDTQAEHLLSITRQHWAVENSLHWTLDMTFREDESRIRKGQAPENFAIMRHIALNILKRDNSVEASVKRKRMLAALNDDLRSTLVEQVF